LVLKIQKSKKGGADLSGKVAGALGDPEEAREIRRTSRRQYLKKKK